MTRRRIFDKVILMNVNPTLFGCCFVFPTKTSENAADENFHVLQLPLCLNRLNNNPVRFNPNSRFSAVAFGLSPRKHQNVSALLAVGGPPPASLSCMHL